jgi:probable rRNA maturation factor
MALEIDIVIRDLSWQTEGEDLAGRLHAAAAALAGITDMNGEACLLLTDSDHMRELNREWRGRDRPTDVLSFEAGPEALPHLGDVAIGLEPARSDAAAMGKRFADHVAHLLVHGLLHLVGHTHENEADAALMEDLEKRALEKLGIADPYSLHSGGARPAEQKNSDAI